jgi:hypothetical protein
MFRINLIGTCSRVGGGAEDLRLRRERHIDVPIGAALAYKAADERDSERRDISMRGHES